MRNVAGATEERILQPLSILVIGAGIGGLTAAIALRARGHDVQMIERDPT